MDQWTSNFRVKTPKRRELNKNFLIFPIPETLAIWTELNQSRNLSVKQTKRQNTTTHLHYQHPVGKSYALGFNTSCQAHSQESSGTFSISSHKDNFEWCTTKVIENISLMPSIGREKNEKIVKTNRNQIVKW